MVPFGTNYGIISDEVGPLKQNKIMLRYDSTKATDNTSTTCDTKIKKNHGRNHYVFLLGKFKKKKILNYERNFNPTYFLAEATPTVGG